MQAKSASWSRKGKWLRSPILRGEAAATDLQHAGRTVHADDPVRQGQEPGQYGSGAAAQVHGRAATLRDGGADGRGQVKIAQHFIIQLVPVFRNGVEKLAGLAGALLQHLRGHGQVGPHVGIGLHKGHEGAQQIVALACFGRSVKNPQSVPT